MDREAFFNRVRKELYPNGFNQSQVDGLNFILDGFEDAKWPIFYAANGLATIKRECDSTYQPIEEYGKGKGKPYGQPTKYHGQVAYGRGFVQLTWALPNHKNIRNYEKADAALAKRGLIKPGDLLANFSLALRPDLAIVIMIAGMDEGWFTGNKNSDYLSGSVPDFLNSRRIINGTDHAKQIAADARIFLHALQDAKYGQVYKPVVETPVIVPPVADVEPVVAPKPLTFAQRLARIFGRG